MSVIDVRRDGAISIAVLNRPERLNALNRDVLDELAAWIAEALADTATRCLAVTGSGERAFCAGADVSGFPALDPLGAQELMRYGQEVFQTLEDSPKPVLAAVNGYALGGGLELALACDFRIAAARAKLGQPEITLANLPGWGGTQRLPQIVGEAAAKDMILTGRLVEAQEARTLGLVHRVAEDDALEATLELARELAGRSPAALAGAKAAIHAARRPGADGYAIERQAVALCFTTHEQQQAVTDFLARSAKRKPAS